MWPFDSDNLAILVALNLARSVTITVIWALVSHLYLVRLPILILPSEHPRDPGSVCPFELSSRDFDFLDRDVVPVVLIALVAIDHIVARDGVNLRQSLRRSRARFRGRRRSRRSYDLSSSWSLHGDFSWRSSC